MYYVSEVKRVTIIKMPVFLKLIYKFNAVTMKISAILMYAEINKFILKFMGNLT